MYIFVKESNNRKIHEIKKTYKLWKMYDKRQFVHIETIEKFKKKCSSNQKSFFKTQYFDGVTKILITCEKLRD